MKPPYSALVLALLLASCAVGPDFDPPKIPADAGYTPEKEPAATTATDIAGGVRQKFVAGQDIPGAWWTVFHSEPLTALSVTHSPSNITRRNARS